MTVNQVLDEAITGTTSGGVPYVALPPEGGHDARALIILWHGADPPRTEIALAGAIPLRDVPAWRIYLGLPLSGQRLPDGGPNELMRRGAEDAVTLLFHPIITGAVDELQDAVEELRLDLGIDANLPLGLFGFSVGGAAALMALARNEVPIRAVATFGAVTDIRILVDYISSMFGATYEWTETRSRLAEQISAVDYDHAIAASGASVLFGVGSDDPNPLRESIIELAESISSGGGTAAVQAIDGVGHGFVDEPGVDAVPQGPQAKAVEQLVARWFLRHLT